MASFIISIISGPSEFLLLFFVLLWDGGVSVLRVPFNVCLSLAIHSYIRAKWKLCADGASGMRDFSVGYLGWNMTFICWGDPTPTPIFLYV